jgi:putative transposase
MPSKYYNRNFRSQYFYHIFNRGAYKHLVFKDSKDYQLFTSILTYYLKNPLGKYLSYFTHTKKPHSQIEPVSHPPTVNLVAYCLMPNHFHLLVKQLPKATPKTNISNLMRRTIITYAMEFQNKYKHNGAIFEGRYKNVTVDTNEQLLYITKYIHQNPHKLVKKLANYPYSSLPVYLKQSKPLDWIYPNYALKLTNNYSKYFNTAQKQSQIDQFLPLTLDT